MEDTVENTYPAVLEAAVIEEGEMTLLVAPVIDGKVEDPEDLYSIPKGESGAQVDDIVQIVYDGLVMDSYPAQLSGVVDVEVIGELSGTEDFTKNTFRFFDFTAYRSV